MGGQLHEGLGEELRARGWDVKGRELSGDFRKLDFKAQVDHVADDLQTEFWYPEARVIANSFGAYLFLHAQAQLPSYVGNVMLLSPITGEFGDAESGRFFSPPCADYLLALAKSGNYPRPERCRIHTGENDWQSNTPVLEAFAEAAGLDVSVVPGAGHALPKAYVRGLLNDWL